MLVAWRKTAHRDPSDGEKQKPFVDHVRTDACSPSIRSVPLSCAEGVQRGITAPFLYAWH